MKILLEKHFSKNNWYLLLGFMTKKKVFSIFGFEIAHRKPFSRLDENKYWYCYIFLPGRVHEGKDCIKIGINTENKSSTLPSPEVEER